MGVTNFANSVMAVTDGGNWVSHFRVTVATCDERHRLRPAF